MTKQQMFDRVARHLLTQGERAAIGSQCLYRTETGLKCALGCLIPDDYYRLEMEGHTVREIVEMIPELRSQIPDFQLADLLMDIHDTCNVKSWQYELASLAATEGLDTSAALIPVGV